MTTETNSAVINHGILVTQQDGTVLTMCQMAGVLLGVDAKQMPGRAVQTAIPALASINMPESNAPTTTKSLTLVCGSTIEITVHTLSTSVVVWQIQGGRNVGVAAAPVPPRVDRRRIDLDTRLSRSIEAIERTDTITTETELPIDEQIMELLKLGCEVFRLPMGIVSHIVDDDYFVQYAAAPSAAPAPAPGTRFDLGNTYCKETLAANAPVAIHHIAESELRVHPCYKQFHLEAYIGTPLIVDGQRWGTLNFSSGRPRDIPFDAHDAALIRLVAQWIGNKLSRRSALAEIERQRGIFESLFRDAPVAIALSTVEREVAMVNPAFCKLFACTPEYAIGKKTTQFYANPMEYEKQGKLRYNKNGESTSEPYTTAYRRADGVVFFAEAVASRIMDAHNHVIGFVIHLQDVSQRKADDQQRQQMETFLNSVIENIPNMIFVKDAKELRFVRFNKAGEDLLGFPRSELIGKNDYDFFPKQQADFFTARDQQVLADKVQVDIAEEFIATRNQGVRVLHTKKLPIFDEQGEPLYLLGISEDITERKASERNIARFKHALDNSSEIIFMFEPDTLQFTYINRGTAQALSTPLTELMALKPFELEHRGAESAFRARLAPLLNRESGSLEYQTEYCPRGRACFAVEVHLEFVQEAGDRGLIVSIARDVTEREHVARLKNEFVSTVSHELRTPLTSIRGSLGLLLGGASGELTPDMRHLVAIAHRNSERLINIVNDILDIEKIKAGKLRAELRPENLVPLVQQAMDSNGAYATQHGVRFHAICHMDRAMVNVDHERFMQIMANLLSNAAKFSPPDAIVDIAIEQHQNKFRVSVSDKGPGIPTAFRADLFKPFSQADASNTRQKGGTGLGLAITKSLVEQMGGEIGFVTSIDVGTTFYVEWPALDAVTAGS